MTQSVLEMFNLSGKVAIVTGATRGIGSAAALALGQCGAKVVLTGRKQEALDEATAELKRSGIDATGVTAHMGDASAIAELVSRTTDLYGGIDVIVNNAATNPVHGPLLANDATVFDKIMDVNVKGPLELAKLAHPAMKARGGGSIINISSVGGLRPEPLLGLYSMSKAALITITKVMAQEWGGDGIRANVICPGLIQTKFSAALWQNEKILAGFQRMLPLARIGQPEELAALIVYLASPASSYCTGASFIADGGYMV